MQVNGLGLALVIPCVQSLIADYYPPDSRGKAFGAMGLTASIGGCRRDEEASSANKKVLELLLLGLGSHRVLITSVNKHGWMSDLGARGVLSFC